MSTVSTTINLSTTGDSLSVEKDQAPDRDTRSITEGNALQRLSKGTNILQGPPQFNSFEKQRRWMLEHMAGAFRVFARKGFTEGVAGHMSLRDPEHPNCFWTNPMAHHFGLMKVSDLILLNDKGEAIGGNTSLPTNAAGFQIHEHIHRAFPHVNAACHAHSVNGRAWSSFGRRLDMIHQDVCNFYGDAHQVYSDFGGVVLDPKEGERLARTLGPNGKGLILQNHGLLTVGKTIDEAAYLFCLLETCCEIQLKVEAAAASGLQRVLVRGDSAVFTYETTSNPEGLYTDFQPDYQYELAASNGAFLE